MAGYKLEALKAEEQRLLDERRVLELEEARLLSPARLRNSPKRQNLRHSVARPGGPPRTPRRDGSLAST